MSGILTSLGGILPTSGGGGPTLVASDDFSWAFPGYAPITDDSDWTQALNTIYTYNNGSGRFAVYPQSASGIYAAAFFNSVAASLNQRVELTIDLSTATTSGKYFGPACRASSNNYYGLIVRYDGGDITLLKCISGTSTDIDYGSGVTVANGDKLAIEVTGSGSATRITCQVYQSSAWSNITGLVSKDPGDYLPAGRGGVNGYGNTAAALPDAVMGDDFAWYDLP